MSYPNEDSDAFVHIYRPFDDESTKEFEQNITAKFGYIPTTKVGGSDKFVVDTNTQLQIGKPINRALKNREHKLMAEIAQAYRDISSKCIEVATSLFAQGDKEDIRNAKGELESAKKTCKVSCLQGEDKAEVLFKLMN